MPNVNVLKAAIQKDFLNLDADNVKRSVLKTNKKKNVIKQLCCVDCFSTDTKT